MPPAMKRLLADLQLPANRFDRRALVEVHLRLAQLRNDLLRRVSLPFHRVLPPSRAVRLPYQLVHLEGVRSAFRRLTEIGLLLIKHRAEDEWFEQVGHLVEESFLNTPRLLRLAPFDNRNEPAKDFDKYVGQGMVALESMLTARTLAAYAIKRKLYQFVSTLLKVVVPIIGAYKELKQSLLLWPLRLGILMPEGVISFCWNNRISTSYKSFFGNWEDFLRPACQLEFILEINSYLGVGEAGPKPKAWLDKYRPDMVFNYVPDHLRYELSVCRPVAEEIYEALKRGPDDWTFVFLSIEKSLFDVVLKGENESQNPFFIAKFLKYLQKYQAQQ